MHAEDPRWRSGQARALIERHDAGGLLRLARQQRGLRQSDLARRLSCSASTLSRLESRAAPRDLGLLRAVGRELEIPDAVLAETLGIVTERNATVTDDPRSSPATEDPMQRRSLLTATTVGLAGSTGLLAAVSGMLTQIPDPVSPTGLSVDQRLSGARALFDAGHHQELLAEVPDLLTYAHQAARSHREIDQARLSAAYALTAGLLGKLGHYDQARTSADRAVVYAEVSGSALAGAAAARELSIVLRHHGEDEAAQRISASALVQVEATGLLTGAQQAAFAQMLCTTAYTHARAGDRSEALELMRGAARAARDLPQHVPPGRLFAITPAAVQLYGVGVHWALGDAGAALEAGNTLHESQFATAERKGRMHTDLARAWWQWDKPQQTADALLGALRVSPAEVRDRPAIRKIVTDLAARHPHTSGVDSLRAALRQRGSLRTA